MNETRCRAILERTLELFPGAGDAAQARAYVTRLEAALEAHEELPEALLAEQIDNTRSGSVKHALDEMTRLVDQGLEILTTPQRSLNDFGALLHQTWCLKRTLSSQVSTAAIDRWYDQARKAGAIGGKLLGAGGGGFLLLMAPPDRHHDVCRAVPDLRAVPFRFETRGSQVLLHQ